MSRANASRRTRSAKPPSVLVGNASSDPLRIPRHWFWTALVAMTLAGGLLRAARLSHPMRFDESHTFLSYVDKGAFRSLFEYESPNNHVLHTLAVLLSTHLLGVQPWAVRFPAFLAGVALIPAMALFARRLAQSDLAALLAAALAAGSSILIEYSANARGYSMLCLAAVLMGVLSCTIVQDVRRLRSWIAWAVVGALGLFVIPTMLYAIALFCIALLLQPVVRGGWRPLLLMAVRLAAFTALALVLAALLYLPVVRVNGWDRVIHNEYLRPQPLALAFFENGRILRRAGSDWIRDTSWMWQVLVAAGALAAVAAAIRKKSVFPALPVLGFAVALVLPIAQRVVPFPRTWLFLFPLILAGASYGLIELLRARWWRRSAAAAAWLATASVLLAAVLSAVSASDRAYLISEDPGTLVDAEAITKDLFAATDGRCVVQVTAPGIRSIDYYIRVNGLAPKGPFQPRAVFVVVGDLQSASEVVDPYHTDQALVLRLRIWRQYPHATVYVLAPA